MGTGCDGGGCVRGRMGCDGRECGKGVIPGRGEGEWAAIYGGWNRALRGGIVG